MNKVELMRQGEATLEKFYPPWMKVIYFRYLRFFPDGVVFMHTSSEDPATTVSQLRSAAASLDGMCRGMYRIENERKVSRQLKIYHNSYCFHIFIFKLACEPDMFKFPVGLETALAVSLLSAVSRGL